jgi:hypothetical protein
MVLLVYISLFNESQLFPELMPFCGAVVLLCTQQMIQQTSMKTWPGRCVYNLDWLWKTMHNYTDYQPFCTVLMAFLVLCWSWLDWQASLYICWRWYTLNPNNEHGIIMYPGVVHKVDLCIIHFWFAVVCWEGSDLVVVITGLGWLACVYSQCQVRFTSIPLRFIVSKIQTKELWLLHL